MFSIFFIIFDVIRSNIAAILFAFAAWILTKDPDSLSKAIHTLMMIGPDCAYRKAQADLIRAKAAHIRSKDKKRIRPKRQNTHRLSKNNNEPEKDLKKA